MKPEPMGTHPDNANTSSPTGVVAAYIALLWPLISYGVISVVIMTGLKSNPVLDGGSSSKAAFLLSALLSPVGIITGTLSLVFGRGLIGLKLLSVVANISLVLIALILLSRH